MLKKILIERFLIKTDINYRVTVDSFIKGTLGEFLLLTGGIPCAKIYERVFLIINSKELENILNDFIMSFNIKYNLEKDIINLDDRVSKWSSRQETEYQNKIKPLKVLNAYSYKYGICLASEMI